MGWNPFKDVKNAVTGLAKGVGFNEEWSNALGGGPISLASQGVKEIADGVEGSFLDQGWLQTLNDEVKRNAIKDVDNPERAAGRAGN